jgi:DNA-binding MarR family transcriptional regulator
MAFHYARVKRIGLCANFSAIRIHHGAAHVAGLEGIGADFGNRRHFGRRTDNETLVKGLELFRHDAAFDDFQTFLLRQRNDRLTGDAVQETIGDRSVDGAVADEEDVGASAFRHTALPIQHHSIGIALLLRFVLGDGADHVKACGLGMNWRTLRVRTAIVCDVELDAFHLGFRIKHRRPGPGGDGDMDFIVLGRNRHHFRTTEGNWAHILVTATHAGDNFVLGAIDLIVREREIKIHDLCRLAEALSVLLGLEDLASIGALSFKHGRTIVQTMGEHVDLGCLPGNDFAIEPNDAFAFVKRNNAHLDLQNFCNAAQSCHNAAGLLDGNTHHNYVNMTDINAAMQKPDTTLSAEEAAELVEMLFFAYRDFVSDADHLLEPLGFGRAHHRVLHFVGRNPGMTVAQLLDILRITKQSLSRVLKDLLEQGYVFQKEGPEDRRQRLLFLAPKGDVLWQKLMAPQVARFQTAARNMAEKDGALYRELLLELINAENRETVEGWIARATVTGSGEAR